MSSGIYKIENLINGNLYIGSTSNFHNRFINHRSDLKRNKHCSKYLQHSWNKYGSDNFKFEILVYCAIEDLLNFEQLFLDDFRPVYNSSKIAGRVSVPRTQEWKDKIGNSNRGKKYTEEQKFNMKQFGWNKKPVYKVCPNTFSILDKYDSASEASRINNVDKGNLLSCVNGKIVLCDGYMYCRIEDYSITNMKKRQKSSKLYKEVYQFDMNNNFIKRYGTIALAAKENNTSSPNIACVLKGKTNAAVGYKWSYTNQIN